MRPMKTIARPGREPSTMPRLGYTGPPQATTGSAHPHGARRPHRPLVPRRPQARGLRAGGPPPHCQRSPKQSHPGSPMGSPCGATQHPRPGPPTADLDPGGPVASGARAVARCARRSGTPAVAASSTAGRSRTHGPWRGKTGAELYTPSARAGRPGAPPAVAMTDPPCPYLSPPPAPTSPAKRPSPIASAGARGRRR